MDNPRLNAVGTEIISGLVKPGRTTSLTDRSVRARSAEAVEISGVCVHPRAVGLLTIMF